ncbi:MAG TPA: acetylglutamate kinase [Candidatus Sumerlaeota bacterium]|nr:acetylglutamate kinase [Candidatus Sumerlaeota bacterium]
MPYIREFHGATIVIKYGGHAMVDPQLKEMVIRDILLLEFIGMNPVVVHGGGPDITRMMDRVGKKPEFVDGLRVTDKDTMELTEMVLAGKLNGELVNHVQRAGGRAVGLSGKDANLIIARKLGSGSGKTKGPDVGFVGEIVKINAEILDVLDEHKFIPVISPIGVDEEGNSYNINADTVAGELAAALKAEKLILLTDVPGVMRDPSDPTTLMTTIRQSEIEGLAREGIVKGGMIPKLKACSDVLDRGVRKVHILDGRMPHSILLELLTDFGVGTQIIPG